MKIWEIKNIESGVKIRQKDWNSDFFMFWSEASNCFVDQEGSCKIDCFYHLSLDTWEYYQEPKLTKIITLYRYTYRAFGGGFIQSSWTSEKASSLDDVAYKIIKTESKEVEVEE